MQTEILEQMTIGEIVAENYRAATVFKKHKIDFCCNGNRSIEEACRAKDLSIWELTKELDAVLKPGNESTIDYDSWPLDLLADYIEKKHHRYVEGRIPEIKPFLDKLCKVHGDRHPELFEIKKHFFASADELTKHMKKEELILFPHIRKMVAAKAGGTKAEQPQFISVKNPIAMMMNEHDNEGERFRQIAGLTNDYNPPADACNTYRVTFALLQEFENDLHLHIHLENNILFKKAVEMEKEMYG
jgi:regulator of cell morphogenesis and NO signaling